MAPRNVDSRSKLRSLLRSHRARGLSALAVLATSIAVTVELVGMVPTHWASAALLFMGAIEGVARYLAFRGGRARALLEVTPEVVATFALLVPGDARPAWMMLAYARSVRLFGLLEPSLRAVTPSTRALARVALGLTLSCAIGSVALWQFEHADGVGAGTPSQVISAVVYSLVAGEPIPAPPMSVGGRITIGLVIVSGLVSFATVAGTVGAVVAERMRAGGNVVDWEDLEGHLVICGWNSKAEVVVREFREAVQGEVPIVVISDAGPEPVFSDSNLRKDVHFLDADFTDLRALERAGIRRASKCILVSDTSRGRSERDADARTVLAALTVERLNPHIYTCAEVHSRDCVGHLRIAHVDDYVVSGEHSAFLLAQSAVTRGVMGVFQELLTFEYGMKFSAVPVPRSLVGGEFVRTMTVLKNEHDAILIGVRRRDGKTLVNPTSHILEEGEHLVVIAKGALRFDI
jgi:voltage-gated potassium channel